MHCALYVVCMAEMKLVLVTPMISDVYQYGFIYTRPTTAQSCKLLNWQFILFSTIVSNKALLTIPPLACPKMMLFRNIVLTSPFSSFQNLTRTSDCLLHCAFPVSTHCIVNGLFDTCIFLQYRTLKSCEFP